MDLIGRRRKKTEENEWSTVVGTSKWRREEDERSCGVWFWGLLGRSGPLRAGMDGWDVMFGR